MQKIKFFLYGILFGIIFFPIITLGDSFVSFLMQGKSAKEAIQILIEQADQSKQMDVLIERIERLENLQEKEEACRKANEIFDQANYIYARGFHRIITARTVEQLILVTQEMIEEHPNYQDDNNEEIILLENKLIELQKLNEEYLLMKEKCED